MAKSKRTKIVEEALTWEGTPFRDQQCVKGLGTDCAMLCFGIAAELGMVDKSERRKIAKYSPEQHYHTNESALTSTMETFGCKEIPIDNIKLGDMVTFEYGNTIGHVGVIIETHDTHYVIIHAVKGTINKVVKSNLTCDLEHRLKKAYKFPGVR